jgi:hypothetical protein
MANLTEVNNLLFTYFFVQLSSSSFSVNFLNLNFGGSGNFLDFLLKVWEKC